MKLWSTNNTISDYEILDIVAINQYNGYTYIASWQNGLAKLAGTELEALYDTENGNLQKRAIHEDWINMGDIQFDSEGNLWCTNSQTYNSLCYVWRGQLESFSLGAA